MIVYFDHLARSIDAPFAEGEAGIVWIEPSGDVETDTQVRISANSLHALHGHGVVEALNALDPTVGPVGSGGDAVISPDRVEEALRLFYEADRMTYGARHDLLVRAANGEDPREYRIVIDNREYQRTLSKLQYMTSGASRMGHGIRLRL